MQGETVRQTVRVVSPNGLHMRPIMAFVQAARNYQSAVVVSKDGRQVDGKSMFEMMTMVAPQGEELTLEATGPDAGAAISALAELIATTSFDDEDEQPLPPKG
jgi:phosphocarrier protein